MIFLRWLLQSELLSVCLLLGAAGVGCVRVNSGSDIFSVLDTAHALHDRCTWWCSGLPAPGELTYRQQTLVLEFVVLCASAPMRLRVSDTCHRCFGTRLSAFTGFRHDALAVDT